jgi:molecular chaperone GrpE
MIFLQHKYCILDNHHYIRDILINEQIMSEPKETPNLEIVTPVAESNGEAEKIAGLEAEVTKYKDQWMRAAAETDNVRKRAERDQQETSKYAITSFARDMVSVLENLKRASEMITPEARASSESMKTFAEGVDLTLAELLAAFERHGIKRIDPLHQKFDHNLHQAVVQIEHPDFEPGTVVQVVQAGYTIHDRLLRPAMVAVSKQGDDASKKVDTSA